MKYSMSLLIALFAASFTLPAVAGGAGGTLTIPKNIPIKKGAYIPDAVKKECHLGTAASDALRDGLGDSVKVVQAGQVSKGTGGKALQLTISRILAPGGGAWSGPKSVTIEGVLWSGGKSLGSFTAERRTGNGGFFGSRGTCGMLERDAKEIGEDIAEWMKAPTAKARLGDAG